MLKNRILYAIFMIFGSTLTIIIQHICVFRIDYIREGRDSDKYYRIARSELDNSRPDYSRLFIGKIHSIVINGKSSKCYFFYAKSYIIYEDDDFIYCFDKKSGKILGRI